MEQGNGFLGIKFNRTMSGRWSANLKREKEEEDEEGGEDWDEQGVGILIRGPPKTTLLRSPDDLSPFYGFKNLWGGCWGGSWE